MFTLAATRPQVHTCPTWTWEAGDPKKARPFLPPGKQFLITRNGAPPLAPLLPRLRIRLPAHHRAPAPPDPSSLGKHAASPVPAPFCVASRGKQAALPAPSSACLPSWQACACLLSAVPCLRRAAAVEEYGEQAEREVEAGDEGEGWITADRSARPGAGATTTNDDGFEEVPSIEEAAGGGGGGAAEAVSEAAGGSGGQGGAEEEGEEDVPDIDDLELEDEEEVDEVGPAGLLALRGGPGGQGCRESPACAEALGWRLRRLPSPAFHHPPRISHPAGRSHAQLPLPLPYPPALPGGAAAGATRRRRRRRRRGAHCADAHVRPAHHLRQVLLGELLLRAWATPFPWCVHASARKLHIYPCCDPCLLPASSMRRLCSVHTAPLHVLQPPSPPTPRGAAQSTALSDMPGLATRPQVPRFWLIGYNEDRQPLTSEQVRLGLLQSCLPTAP